MLTVYGCLTKRKGIYQKYMTWFDGNPSHLWQYPPREEGERYIACIGGIDALCAKAEEYIQTGDSRFAATLLGHAKAAEPSHKKARILLATAYENLGYGAENATWRNFYLVAAKELRTGEGPGLLGGGRTALGPSLTVEQWFDILSVQVDGEKAAAEERCFAIDFELFDVEEAWRLILSNGVLVYRRLDSVKNIAAQGKADLKVSLAKPQLLQVLRGNKVEFTRQVGNTAVLQQLIDLITVPEGSKRGPSQI